jgi:hypothetical protein
LLAVIIFSCAIRSYHGKKNAFLVLVFVLNTPALFWIVAAYRLSIVHSFTKNFTTHKLIRSSVLSNTKSIYAFWAKPPLRQPEKFALRAAMPGAFLFALLASGTVA